MNEKIEFSNIRANQCNQELISMTATTRCIWAIKVVENMTIGIICIRVVKSKILISGIQSTELQGKNNQQLAEN